MAGYRGNSGFDPWAYEQAGRPMRPYNWVQWTGAAFAALGVLGYLLWAAEKLGWISIGLKEPAAFISLPLIGVALINSRREPGTTVDSEQRRRNRRMLLITILVCVVIFGAAITISAFKGA